MDLHNYTYLLTIELLHSDIFLGRYEVKFYSVGNAKKLFQNKLIIFIMTKKFSQWPEEDLNKNVTLVN